MSFASFSLDATYGNGGKVITPFGNESVLSKAVLQNDGKAIVVGFNLNGGQKNWAIGRYNIDGSLDNSFGTNGTVTQNFGIDNVAHDVAIQSDGKILVAGSDAAGNGSRVWTVGRYSNSGVLDTNFGKNGILASPIGDDLFEILTGLVVQPDQKIITTGYLRRNSTNVEYVALVRYNSDGSYDQTFGTGGVVTRTFTTFERARSVSLQNDGKIVVFGEYSDGLFTLRFNSDGSPDSTFGNNGLVTDFNGTNVYGPALALQPDGKIVVTGAYSTTSGTATFVIRYNPDGSHDSGFANNGIFTSAFGATTAYGTSVVIQPDGKIVVGGVNDTNSVIRRFNMDGTMDNTFATNGSIVTPITSGNNLINSIQLQSDGKILAVGQASNGSYNDWALVRYADSSSGKLQVPLFKQTASSWGWQTYDGANFWSSSHQAIADWGCALTSDAMILKYYGVNKLPDGSVLDPGTLNTWLKNNNGYDDGINNGYIIPTAISRLSKLAKSINNITSFDALETKIFSGFNSGQLTTDLHNNQPDMLGVSGNSHYVVATGISGNTFTINDPYFNRSSLTDGYNNTFASLTQYKPSFTDLSYIFITASPHVQLLLKDTNSNSVGEQFVQNPLINDVTGLPSGQSSQVLFFQKPVGGDYKLLVSGGSNQNYKINAYIYDKDGNTQRINQQGTISSANTDTIAIHFDNQNVNDTRINRLVTFQSTINDINENRSLNQINKFPTEALVTLVNVAKRDSEAGKKALAKLSLDTAKLLLTLARNKGVTESAYQILLYDINALKSSL